MHNLFFELTTIIVLATVLGMIARWLKQPTILGYLITGLLAGPLGLLELANTEILDVLAQIGITFLLFLVGMEMRFEELKHVGKPALMTGIGQILFTSLVGFFIIRALGYELLPAIYIAIALTFSSTIIVVKLLSEKNALGSLYGKIVVGFLLVQDFVALGALIFLSGLKAAPSLDNLPYDVIGLTFLKGSLLLVATILVGKYIMPWFLHKAGRYQEILFMISLAWGMGMAALASLPIIGLSIEFGAFVAGVAMASSVEHFQISSRLKSLRDFFLVMFFVVLGSKMVFSSFSGILLPTFVLSIFVLIGNPVIVMLIMGGLGYRSRTSFLSSVTVAQISEFSLVLIALGHRLGHVDQSTVTLVTAIGIITITLSSYLILYGDYLHDKLRKPLRIFEFNLKGLDDAGDDIEMEKHIVLIGSHRMGHNILHSLEEMKKKFLVVDFNPVVVEKLLAKGANALYGDITDPDIQERAGLARAKMVISTVPTYEDSLNVLEYMKHKNPKAKIILTGETEDDALRLYENGADYVLLPHFIGGLQLAKTIESNGFSKALQKMKRQDLKVITELP